MASGDWGLESNSSNDSGDGDGGRWPGCPFISKVLLESPCLEPHFASIAYTEFWV